uniref:Histidine protein kinase sensor protein n=1 Tax=Loigolactobacillus rennini TaxID=238013 RepID=A0A1K2I5K5_9LACO|nr:histidine protein kinase; sensor protein [Loigolactobacillus rennini]
MYNVGILEVFLYDSITNILMLLFYSFLVQQKYRKLAYTVFSLLMAIVGIYIGDLIQLLFLAFFLSYQLIRQFKLASLKTLAFIFVLCCDMLLANLATLTANILSKQLPLTQGTLAIVINPFFYLIVILAYFQIKEKVIYFEQHNLSDPRLLKIVINFALIIFLSLQIIQFVADILSIAVVFQWLIIIVTFFFIIATIVVMFYFIRSYQLVLKKQAEEQTYQNLLDYTDKLEDNYAQLRKFKHDYQNVLLSLNGYIQQSQQADLKAYYRQIVLQTGKEIKTDNMRFDGLEALKVPALQSLTYQKLVTARKYNITTFLEVRDPITAVPVDMVKLVRILGILLDNAIEATYRQDHGVIRIAYIKYNQAEIEVIIQNTIAEDQPLALNELFDAGYTSKGSGHGMGLTTVKQMVDAIPNMTLEVKVVAGQYRVMIDLVRM